MSFVHAHPALVVAGFLVVCFLILLYAAATAPYGEEIEGRGFVERDGP